MKKAVDYKAGIEIYRRSYKVLFEELGALDFIRFIQEFDKGEGNYAEDRHFWQDKYSVEEIIEEYKKENS